MRYEEAVERGYDGPPPWAGRNKQRYACCDRMCGARDCETCYPGCSDEDEDGDFDRSAEVTKVVTARKARKDTMGRVILPGDRVEVTRGFHYRPGGPRVGYYLNERRVKRGPGHDAPDAPQDTPNSYRTEDIPF